MNPSNELEAQVTRKSMLTSSLYEMNSIVNLVETNSFKEHFKYNVPNLEKIQNTLEDYESKPPTSLDY